MAEELGILTLDELAQRVRILEKRVDDLNGKKSPTDPRETDGVMTSITIGKS